MANELSTEDALTNIDNALASLNGNRQTHAILLASLERVRSEIVSLNTRLLDRATEVSDLYQRRIAELEQRIQELGENPPPPALM